jgi:hypothetical protein
MAKVSEEMNRFRMNNMQIYAKWIGARGPLAVSTRRAGEIMWPFPAPMLAACSAMRSAGPSRSTRVGSPTPSSAHCSQAKINKIDAAVAQAQQTGHDPQPRDADWWKSLIAADSSLGSENCRCAYIRRLAPPDRRRHMLSAVLRISPK